jgi:hypothetical protein
MYRHGMDYRKVPKVAKHVMRTLNATGARLGGTVHHVVIRDPVHCNPDVLEQIRSSIKPFRCDTQRHAQLTCHRPSLGGSVVRLRTRL